MKSSSRVLALAVLAASSILLPACAEKASGPSPAKLLKQLLKEEVVRIEDEGYQYRFTRLPLDLWTPFRWEVKFGVFDESRAAGLAGAIFGTELDERGVTPFRFFGFYGQYVSGGVQVFVSSGTVPGSGATNHGDRFYAGTPVVETVIEADGSNLVFRSRPAGSEAAYDVIATVPFASQPHPLNPGIGVFGFSGEGEVGFGCIRLPENGSAPEPVSPEHAAVNDIVAALLAVADGRYELSPDSPDSAAGLEALREARTLLASAREAVVGLDVVGKVRTPAEQAVRQIDKAAKKLEKAVKKLEKRGDRGAKKAFKTTGKILFPLVVAADWIMPEDLRATINGTPNTLR